MEIWLYTHHPQMFYSKFKGPVTSLHTIWFYFMQRRKTSSTVHSTLFCGHQNLDELLILSLKRSDI